MKVPLRSVHFKVKVKKKIGNGKYFRVNIHGKVTTFLVRYYIAVKIIFLQKPVMSYTKSAEFFYADVKNLP